MQMFFFFVRNQNYEEKIISMSFTALYKIYITNDNIIKRGLGVWESGYKRGGVGRALTKFLRN